MYDILESFLSLWLLRFLHLSRLLLCMPVALAKAAAKFARQRQRSNVSSMLRKSEKMTPEKLWCYVLCEGDLENYHYPNGCDLHLFATIVFICNVLVAIYTYFYFHAAIKNHFAYVH